AFGRVVMAYQTPVYNLCYRMLGNAAEAEEAAQETFLRAYTHLRSYDPQRPFRSWLLSIASHYCIDRLRRRRITWLPLQEELIAPTGTAESSGRPSGQGVAAVQLASGSPAPERVVAQREREAHIQELLAGLSPTDRAAITLRYWYDCSYEEIAESLTLTVSAVKSRLYRARRALAGMMEGETDNVL
ncbi:MAG: sigma-70 family RNA polymerase sigma factor, partial [Anaerolineae bacterium]|nr:sigma-70 family RNA polymerase sigma factor [Anaerolineae bacterium]